MAKLWRGETSPSVANFRRNAEYDLTGIFERNLAIALKSEYLIKVRQPDTDLFVVWAHLGLHPSRGYSRPNETGVACRKLGTRRIAHGG